MKTTKISYLAIIISFLFLQSCFKENVNNLPLLEELNISRDTLFPGDTTSIRISAIDEDEDSIYYFWSANSGNIIESSDLSLIQWASPFQEGMHNIECQLHDGKSETIEKIPIFVNGFLYEDFKISRADWDSKNAVCQLNNDQLNIIQLDPEEDAHAICELDKSISPPYTILMSVTHTIHPELTEDDKFGLMLDFLNTGSDTLVKALWLTISPENDLTNWKLNLLVDNGNTSKWIHLDDDSFGYSSVINSAYGTNNNHFKFYVNANNEIEFYLNNRLMYSSNALNQDMSSPDTAPSLKLQKIVLRSSKGPVSIDNVFITRNKEATKEQIFD